MKNYKLILAAILIGLSSSTLLSKSWKCFLWPFTNDCKREKEAEKAAEAKGAKEAAINKSDAIEKITIEVKKDVPGVPKKERHWYNLWRFWDMSKDEGITNPQPVVITKTKTK